ncbi:MAG: hypothetical protein UR26_C0002G0151 [candidate division TM6 bacterium GW2011_GWF2_32_72]|nr:MAG: hypothetical protein UR26_C0002G0151 [candidate division TM6 bacterium GW2011_GWF2_32_72]
MIKFRLAASGIILHQNKILLVRYKNSDSGTFLVGPGGGVNPEEDLYQALIREVKEETGLQVRPGKMLFVEDLLSSRWRMLKIWFLCSVESGQLTETADAKDEGIIEVNWYDKEQLENEIVYPKNLLTLDWNDLVIDKIKTEYLTLTVTDF